MTMMMSRGSIVPNDFTSMLTTISQLSADTLKMLQEFNTEKDERNKQFQALKAKSENESKLSMDLFGEDWNASQVLSPLRLLRHLS